MKPLTKTETDSTNIKQKVALVVFGDSEISSASLHEFGKFCLNNKEMIN